ncbi:MAG: C25 family cysteine peptidase [Bacteroidales bacterium]|nr:C25 family cysteine peptidase [Bacteroidales bacterium]
MKRLAFICFFLLSFSLFGQYSNSWIDYSQRYFRIPITSEGVYKVTYDDLVANGISVGDFDHRNLQVIHNGKVIPLFVSAQSDGIFRNTDYFEFYAEGGNNGWLDSRVYYSGVPFNEEYSLYNDTASYFLTFANTLESPRYDTVRNVDYSKYSALSYCYRTIRNNYKSTFNETNSSSYILPAEGWCDNYFDMGSSIQKILSTPNYASIGESSMIKFGIGGFSETQHDIVVTVSSDKAKRYQKTYSDYNAIHDKIVTDEPLASTTTVTFQSVGGDKTADKNAVSYVEIVYPCKLNFNNQNFFKFTVPAVESEEYILLEITNFNAGGTTPILYCPDLQCRILTTNEGGVCKVLLPNKKRSVECVLVSQKVFKKVPEIMPIYSKISVLSKFLDFSQEENQGDYIIITEKSLWNQANLYKQYRQKTGQNVVLVDVEELYNQFAYGVRKHPYAISAFIEFAVENWGIAPSHVFLIGKGFHVSKFRNNDELYSRTLIPPMGNPASDLLFTMDVKGKSIRPNIAIGRIAAESLSDVEIYKNKVIDFEAQEPNPWMKNVIHFGGGTTALEQSTFRRYLTQYASTLRSDYFGADVHSFYKESSDVYETTEPAAIRKYMNEGTSLVTFFGHASGSGFDQNIDHPSLFNNKGRYPLIVANSCYSGDIFSDNDYNVSKIWTFIADKGSIGFLANVGSGSPNYLNIFSSAFMRNIAYSNYGNSIGSSIAKTMQDLSNKNIVYECLYDGIIGFTLQGDPLVKIHSFEKPDFEIDETSVYFDQQIISTEQENFQMYVALRNNGRAYSSDYTLRATFTPSKGNPYVFETTRFGSYCHDTLSFTLDMANFVSGEYTVTVEVDYLDSIAELSEENNTATVSLFISSREVLPIYPSKYAIIPTDTISLQMSSVDPLNPPSDIKIEIDTVNTFDSPLLSSTIIQTEGNALVSWKPKLTFIDNTTYFWRVTSTDSVKWNESSFTYESGKTGWGQIHRSQFTENSLTTMTYNDTLKKYSFVSIPHEISVRTRGNCSTEKEYYECLYVIDATQQRCSGTSLSPTLIVSVLDSTSLTPWYSNRGIYGHRNTGEQAKVFEFSADNASVNKSLASFLIDTVPDGNYILCYSFVKPNCQSWDDSLKNALDSLGVSKFRDVPNDYPYIFFLQKGRKEKCFEIVGDSAKALIRMDTVINANLSSGYIRTENIGPAKTFKQIVWNTTKKDLDKATLSVYQKTKDGHSYILGNLSYDSWTYLDSTIDTKYYPFLSMLCYMQDDDRTPPDLNFWKVYYSPAAELAITPQYAFSLSTDTIQQGDEIGVIVSAKNVTETSMDSVLVLYEFRNEQNELVDLQYKRIKSIAPYDYVVDTQYFSTLLYSGKITLKVEFNPVNPSTGMYDQAEANHFNNFCYGSFFVSLDGMAPVLDVVVDGRHLINGDKVSQNPEIQITLSDENKYLSVVADTSLFSVYIVNIETNEIKRYYFADSSLVLLPVKDGANMSLLVLNPIFVDEGVYELHVQAQDVTGNYVASQEYIVEFEVSLEKAVSVLYNYPNPCRGYTTFRFVLSGQQSPENVVIKIADAKGLKVGEIPVKNAHIGTNEINVSLENINPGIYFYQLDFDEKSSWKVLNVKTAAMLNKNCGRLIIER